MRSFRRSFRSALLILLLLSLAACSNNTITRPAIESSIKKGDSPWSQAVSAPFRADLAKFANAPIVRQHLTYDPADRKLSGTAEILFTNENDRSLATLYMRTMAKFWGSPGSDNFAMSDVKVDGKATEFTVGDTLVTIPLAKPLEPGKSAVITYAATVTLPKLGLNPGGNMTMTANVGFYGAGADFTGLGGFPLLLPKGDEGKEFDKLPNDRPTDGGELCLGEFWVTIPQEWSAIAYGAVLDETPAKDGKKTVHTAGFTGGSATIMLLSKTAVKRSQKVGDLELNVYVDPFYAQWADPLMKNAADALQVYQKAFGPLGLPKLDVTAMPLRSVGGAYMNGILAMNTAMLKDSREVAPSGVPPALLPLFESDSAQTLRKGMFHEVAHAWWGNMVSPDGKTLPWFHEALADASSIYAVEQADGAAAGAYWRTKQAFNYQKPLMLGMPDAPLNWPMEKYKDQQQRSTLTYYKGGLFYDKLRKQVGDEKFNAAMRSYIAQHAFDSVSDRGPVEALMQEPGVEALYRRWVEEAHGLEDIGVPELHDPTLRKQLGLPPE